MSFFLRPPFSASGGDLCFSPLWSNPLTRCYTNEFNQHNLIRSERGAFQEIMLKPVTLPSSAGRDALWAYCGKLKDFTAQELGAVAAKGAIERSGIDPKEFDHAVFGNAQQTSGDALYGARHVGLRAGLPIETPALTVNRLCGQRHAGDRECGADDPDRRSEDCARGRDGGHVAGAFFDSRARWIYSGSRRKMEDSLMVALLDSYCGLYMANTAEFYGEQQGITRQAQDEFALRSQQKADAAYKEGRIQEELVPVRLRNPKGEDTGESLAEDDHRGRRLRWKVWPSLKRRLAKMEP